MQRFVEVIRSRFLPKKPPTNQAEVSSAGQDRPPTGPISDYAADKVNYYVKNELDLWNFYSKTAMSLNNPSPPLFGFNSLARQLGSEHIGYAQGWTKYS